MLTVALMLTNENSIQFKAMSFAMLDEDHKQPTAYKLICVKPDEKVVGLHIIGEGSDEILQGCELGIFHSISI